MTSRQQVIDLLKFVRSISDGILKGFPEDKMTWQTGPEDNHALWVLGHLASTDGWLASMVNAPGTTAPESWQKPFGQGSKPVSDPKQYPSVAELKKAFDENRAAVLKWFETAPESALATPLKDKTGGFMNDPIDGAMKIAWHEGWHMGQVATLRKALGLPSVMG